MGTIDLNRWMAQIDDNRSLSAISIPGTHDSCATKMNGVPEGMARCQNHDINRQLREGIRFLDIRLRMKDGMLQVFHGDMSCHQTFGDLLAVCIYFLHCYPSETIVMLVNACKPEYDDFAEEFKVFVRQFSGLFYLGDIIPTLRDARGKIVVLKRFKKDVGLGIDLSVGWPQNTTGVMATSRGERVHVEDCYKGLYHDTHEKWDEVKSHLDQAKYGNRNELFITFNSVSQGSHTPYQYAWGLGKSINPQMNPTLIGYTEGSRGTRWGVVPVDYYNNEDEHIDLQIAQNLVESNFEKKKNYLILDLANIETSHPQRESSSDFYKVGSHIVARLHERDENGPTHCKYASFALPEEARRYGFTEIRYSELRRTNPPCIKESESDIRCEDGEVLFSRRHDNDENGPTYCGIMRLYALRVVDGCEEWIPCITVENESVSMKESSGEWAEKPSKSIVRRIHKGDENAFTTTHFAHIAIPL